MADVLMLGVSGLRGVVGSTLTPEVVARYAGTFAGWLAESAGGGPVEVVLGGDGRAGGEVWRRAAIAGLAAAGCRVVDLGVAMTPTVAVMTDRLAQARRGAAGGMVVTASHNPQQWNGLKCLVPTAGAGVSACAPGAALAQQIVDRFKGAGPALARWDALGSVLRDESSAVVHTSLVLEALAASGVHADPGEIGRGLSVVVDSVNASGVEGARELLESLGVEEFMHLGCEETGLFPHAPEPVRENLGVLAEAVRESGAHVGLAQDPDGDRLALIDERGGYIGEEYTLVLGAWAVLEGMKRAGVPTAGAALAANLSTSRMIDDLAARYGATVVRTPVGEANVAEAMKARSAVVGGEGNGGVMWPRVTYVRDSLSAMALTLSLLEGGARTLSGLVAQLPRYAIVKRKVDLAGKEAAAPAVSKLARHFSRERVDLQDGVRVDIDSRRAWLHVRASNTEPIMRLIAEAPDQAGAAALLDEAAAAIR